MNGLQWLPLFGLLLTQSVPEDAVHEFRFDQEEGTPLAQFIAEVNELTDQPFLVRGEDLEGAVLPNGEPYQVARSDVLDFFEERLESVGFRLVSVGAIQCVWPASLAAGWNTYVPSNRLTQHRRRGQVVTILLPLKGLQVDDIRAECGAALRPFGDEPIVALVGPAGSICEIAEGIRRRQGLGPLVRETGPLPGTPEETKTEGLNIQFDEVVGTQLADFVDMGRQLLGREIRLLDESLGDRRIRIVGAVRTTPAEFRKLFESILMAIGVVVFDSERSLLLCDLEEAPREFTQRRLRALIPTVPPSELEQYQQRFVPVRTVIELSRLDGPTTVEFLRWWTRDNGLEGVRQEAGSNQLTLTGFGFKVWRNARIVRELERLAADH